MTECGVAVDARGCARPQGHGDDGHDVVPRIVWTDWKRARQVGEVLDAGRPRPAPWSPSGFDLSWTALDAWATSMATGNPCEIVLTGLGRREDGAYFYREEINRGWLIEVQGLTRREDGSLVPACRECGGYPRHSRGCAQG